MAKPVIVPEALFDKLMLAETERQLVVFKFERELLRATEKLRTALIAAGLEPNKPYKIDEASRSFTLIDEQENEHQGSTT